MRLRGMADLAIHILICMMIAAAAVLTMFNVWGPVTRFFKAMGG